MLAAGRCTMTWRWPHSLSPVGVFSTRVTRKRSSPALLVGVSKMWLNSSRSTRSTSGNVPLVRTKAALSSALMTARRWPRWSRRRSVTQWIDGLGLRRDAAALLGAVVRLATYVDDPDRMDAGAALAQVVTQTLAHQLGHGHAPARLRIRLQGLGVGIGQSVQHGG